MDCSRCGGDLEVYSLGEQEAYVCADCGFVDTTVEHEVKTRPEPEPWERALERFYRKHVDTEAAIVGSGETAALVEVEPDSDDSAVEASTAAETAADVKTEPDDEPTDGEEAEPDDEPAAEQPR
ncbi:Zn finger domain containing protein [Halapricum desulfuricans]|uniref:Zn finger domain containing protein n=1 Tax=Halapricum desulfuricans TaxID=2841257 RepID=A0A897NLR8_9EURY|nr:hypothetical protein [Halapricum desulfuricans]QSG11166.1 Zn finger domain containing protein [Halapricum desulfuricans]